MTVEEIAERARTAFLASVAKDNPHVKTGDLFPDEEYEFEQATEQVVWRWLEHNDTEVDRVHRV